MGALRQQCSRLQTDLRRVQGENAALARDLEQRERDLEEQRRRMRDLQGTIQDQRADIRSALDMVSGRCPKATTLRYRVKPNSYTVKPVRPWTW